jgi:hypothetical protein
MYIEKSFRVSRNNGFLVSDKERLHMTTMETRKNTNGDAMVFMALMFLCRFLLFRMRMLLWILSDAS